MQLTQTEVQLMEFIWQQERAFLKDLILCYPDPKPATTTIATLLKRMQDKNFVGYKLYGNSREYFPLVEKSTYFSKHLNGMIKSFFNDSVAQFGSFFAKDTNLSMEELEDLKAIIEQEIERQKSW